MFRVLITFEGSRHLVPVVDLEASIIPPARQPTKTPSHFMGFSGVVKEQDWLVRLILPDFLVPV